MSTFANYLQSPTIRLITSTGTEYTVHRSLLQTHLPTLQLPARQTYLDLDVSAPALGLLLEYIYTGDYHPDLTTDSSPKHHTSLPTHHAKPHHHQPPSHHPAAKPKQTIPPAPSHPMLHASRSAPLGVWGRPAALHSSYFHEGPVTASADNPHDLVSVVRTDSPLPPAAAPALTNGTSHTHDHAHAQHHDHTSQSLSSSSPYEAHAGVYALASRYNNHTLQAFALAKLKAALKTAELEPEHQHHVAPVAATNGISKGTSTAALVRFIKEVYAASGEHAPAEGESVGNDKKTSQTQTIRDVVVAQAVGRLSELQRDEEFNAFVKGQGGVGGGEFVADLLDGLAAGKGAGPGVGKTAAI